MNELQGKIESVVSDAREGMITYSELERELKKRYVIAVLLEYNCNVSRAARELGWHRNTASRSIHDLGIKISELRKEPARKGVRSVGVESERRAG